MNRIKSHNRYLPVLLAAAGSLIYISLIFNKNLWMDEAFSAVLVRGSFKEMLDRSLADTLPPLYNILAWLMTKLFGYSTLTLKLTSVLPMIFLMFFSAVKLPKLYDLRTASIFVLCLFSMPCLLHYGVEIRMYSLCLSFTTIAGIYALQFYKDPDIKTGLLLSVFSALSAYSHHYGIIALAFVWIYLFLYFFPKDKKALKNFFISVAVTVFLCIPYVMISIIQIRNSTSYFNSGSSPVNGFFAALRYPYVTNITILSAALLLSVIFICIRGSRLKEGYALLSVYILVLILSYALMIITGKVFFSGRYLVPSLGLLWLGYSILLKDIKKPGLSVIYIILILSVFAVCAHQQFLEEYEPGVSDMLSFFEKNLTPEDGYIIYEDNYEIEWCMRYYEPELKKYEPEDIDEIEGNIWYFSVPGYENMLDESIKQDYNIVYKEKMCFDIYSFDLYQLTEK